MKAQIGDRNSGIHLYFDIRYNFDGRFINCTRTQQFTSMGINEVSFPLESGCTPRILNSTELAHLKIFPRNLNVPRHRKPPYRLMLGFVLQWLENKLLRAEC
jgi:hypothetical protein